MFIKPETDELFVDHSAIRARFLNVLFPEVIDDEMLAFHGVFPVAAVAPPGGPGVVAVEGPPENVAGAWRQTWGARPATLAEQQAQKAEMVKFYDGAVQKHLDDAARSFGYGDPNRPEVSPILHAISYADEPIVARFQDEGRALRAWRSLVWAAAGVVLAEVEAGARSAPSVAELLAELPAAPVQEPA